MIFFILVGGAPGTIWDHIKPKNGRKKGSKKSQKRAKIGQDITNSRSTAQAARCYIQSSVLDKIHEKLDLEGP